ncbi:P-type ATPase [Enterospora canceri]|uniref:P-type ATPase n=1 Tax=Enterospora canceri TaxID=1081671 RepID=A0A1Y1S8N2_9MICR|nr:P-type ATPase [Enterospora canceri]
MNSTRSNTTKFYTERPWYLSLYMLPLVFAPLLALSRIWYELGIVLLTSSLCLFLATYWSSKIHIFECFTEHKDLSQLSTIENLFIFYQNEICRIFKEDFKKEGLKMFFVFNNEKYFIENLNNKTVKKISPQWNYTLQELMNGDYCQKYQDHFPKNTLQFPRRTFVSLFKEQITSPLFCFSIFSSILTLFDDYVLNSLFSIAVSFGAEGAMTLNHLVTLKMFQNYEIVETPVTVIKKKSETKISSTALVPGDVIVLSNQKSSVTCDMLILDGSAVVNEAMLSGESVPLVKNAVSNSKTSDFFDESKHKKHLLFSGTEVLKVLQPTKCLVLKTGFETEKGILLNKMLLSDELKYDKEALKFVIALSTISVLASILMFFYSTKRGHALFLDIVILFTNSIPFELPLEMGTSVQMAVRSLFLKGIYCLEPYRIQQAGKLNVCCFDKTGTLTENTLKLIDVVQFEDDSYTDFLLSCCNDLQLIENKFDGDPLDMAIFDYLQKKNRFVSDFTKVAEYPFSSESRRQSVIVEHGGRRFLVTKGAPETVAKLLESEVTNYDEYEEYAKEGHRVIAVAYKEISGRYSVTQEEKNEMDHSNLTFCCFLLFGTEIKEYAKETVRQLIGSNHRVVMITGDNRHTAQSVAARLGVGGEIAVGSEIDSVLQTSRVGEYGVFARADPSHKERIVEWYRRAGKRTMMVGDGTNDVGALKAADVGVAVLACSKESSPAHESTLSLTETVSQFKPGDASVAAPFTIRSSSLRPVIDIVLQGRSSASTTVQMYKILALNSLISAFTIGLLDLFEIKFSEKQMLSLGVLNSLAFNAISRGKTLDVVDGRRVADSIFSTGLVCSVLLQGALHTLCFVALVWLFGDDALVVRYFTGHNLSSESTKSGESTKFAPGSLNTAVFALGMVQTIATFAFNYIGRPFREDISENPMLLLSLVCMLGIPLNIILNIHGDLNEWLGCVDLGGRKSGLIGLCVAMIGLTWIIDLVCKDRMLHRGEKSSKGSNKGSKDSSNNSSSKDSKKNK